MGRFLDGFFVGSSGVLPATSFVKSITFCCFTVSSLFSSDFVGVDEPFEESLDRSEPVGDEDASGVAGLTADNDGTDARLVNSS